MSPVFAEISEMVWQAIIAAVVTIVLAWMQQRTKGAVEKGTGVAQETARTAAVKTEEVKETLVMMTADQNNKLDSIAHTGDATHTLVNNNMAIQLRLNAELSLWKAQQTRVPEDVEAAEKAEKLYKEHMAKQTTVDSAKKQS